MISKRIVPIAFFASAMVAAASSRADETDTRPLSPAQIALFESDHLKNIGQPERLEYRFNRNTEGDAKDKAGGSYADRVDLDVRPRADRKKDIWVDFLSGEHNMPFPPVTGFKSNPVVMFFLEHDVEEMQRHLGGAASYFRKRIRDTFVDRAQLKPVEVTRDGSVTSGTEITLAPFTDDPRIAVFPDLKSKFYRFILSDSVPGGIYEIASEIPNGAGQPPSVREAIVFYRESPCEASEGPCLAAGSQ
jgi:hypothetical protein